MTDETPYTTLHIRAAILSDREILAAMMPQLANFAIPDSREPQHLWQGDLNMLNATLRGGTTNTFVDVLIAGDRQIVGLVMVTMCKELLSEQPSAHLEALVVDPEMRGQGLGHKLMQHAEDRVRQRGAQSLTLHVFSTNLAARKLYDSRGFDSELIRAVKWL